MRVVHFAQASLDCSGIGGVIGMAGVYTMMKTMIHEVGRITTRR